MAFYSVAHPDELAEFVAARGCGTVERCEGLAGGSVNSSFRVHTSRGRVFLRIYEEQDARGAHADAGLAQALDSRGIRTPRPISAREGEWVSTLAGKPAVLFEWVDGEMRCQRSVDERAVRQVGAELARVHAAGLDAWARPSRFSVDDLFKRIEAIAADSRHAEHAPGLRSRLEQAVSDRDPALPTGLVHGDLFRDNVLFGQNREISALIDFESASVGAYAYDLSVTLLAWCFGDDLDLYLVRAMVAGYEQVRSLSQAERSGLLAEARVAALRFTITRITDYAMRGGQGRVIKDWRRFEARADALAQLRPSDLLP